MNSLYVTSVERYSGKTAVCLALGARFREDGYTIGYLKPLSLQPYKLGDEIVDEDAAFVINTLNLNATPADLSPVVVTQEYLRELLSSGQESQLMERVKATFEGISSRRDIMLLEGGASLREGYVVGLPTIAVAQELSSCVLVIVRYKDAIRMLDDALATKHRLGDRMCGLLINRVPPDAMNFVHELAVPNLEKRGIPVFGVFPEVSQLAALTVEEIVSVLSARVLTKEASLDNTVETLTVGAMTADTALSIFRKQAHKAVITGGDRTDIQLAALETSTACLVLTGNLRPSPLVIKQAEEFNVPVLLVRTNTMETVELIERIFGKTRLGQTVKLENFEQLFRENFDLKRLYESMGLQAKG